MNEKLVKEIQTKISDYTRYIYILLAVSTFLYLGTVIGDGEKTLSQMLVMSGTTIALLGFSFYFAYKTKKLHRQLQQEEQ
ncbi:Ca2+/Na+ antiporter [Bacillus fengqiuensis]|nr:Ca2+/Na+ antiporter [Bacillus fengqiuensis]